MWHIWGRGNVHIGFWWGNLRERDSLEDLHIYGRKILKQIFINQDGGHGLAQDRHRWLAVVTDSCM